MKIAFVTSIFAGPELDALTARFFAFLVRLQAERGHEVLVLTVGQGDRLTIEKGIRVIQLRLPDPARTASGATPVLDWCLPRALALYQRGAGYLADFQPDVVQCVKPLDALPWQHDYPTALILVTPQLEIMRRGLNGTFQPLDTAWITGLEAMGLACADALAAPSRAMAQMIREVARRDDVAIYPPACQSCPCEPVAASGELTLLYAGSIDSYKGADLLVESLALLGRQLPDWHLTMAGEEPGIVGQAGTLAAQLRKRLRALGLHQRVAFRGALRADEYAAAFGSATMVVFPFRYCGTTYHIVEALAHSAVVLATRVGTIEEELRHGETACLVAPDDPQALADAIVTLATDGEFRHRLREQGAAHAREHFAPAQLGRFVESLSEGAVAHFRLRSAESIATRRLAESWLAAASSLYASVDLALRAGQMADPLLVKKPA